MIRKGMISTGGKAAAAGIQLVNGIIIARMLQPAGTGILQNALGFNLILMTIAALGFGPAAVYYINKEKVSIRVVTTTLLWYCLLSLPVVFCILQVIYPRFPRYFAS